MAFSFLFAMKIRHYLRGDEAAQAEIYNEAAGTLPKFKPATADEVARRCRAPDFDPRTRFYAEDQGRILGYATYHANGRVNYPWCRRGFESAAEPLFEAVLRAMRERQLPRAFAAYRGDWPVQLLFFKNHDFQHIRDMVNFIVDRSELKLEAPAPGMVISTLRRADVPAIVEMAPTALRLSSVPELERHFFENRYFSPEAVFAVREGENSSPSAAGVWIQNSAYGDAKVVDAAMPCFRLGAFGSEGMQTKRLNGLFSLLAPAGPNFSSLASASLGWAATRLQETQLTSIAAQVPSDVPHLLRFYQERFHKQGSFPILERRV